MNVNLLRDQLLALSKDCVVRFLNSDQDVYGLGFFCDAYEINVYLVANTRKFLAEQAKLAVSAKDSLKWDTGNWEWPGGLFPSASPEQRAFDNSWKSIAKGLGSISQQELELCCRDVLVALNEIVDLRSRGIEGLVVQGPDDSESTLMQKLIRLC